MMPIAGNMRSFPVPIDEQVALVNGTVAYDKTSFSINPGSAVTFPFLSRTAQNYERYEFQDLRFEFRPSVYGFAAVGAQGFVGISATMDALQSPPSTQAQAEVMHHSPVVETAHVTSLSLPKQFLLTKSMREKFFVRPNGLIPGGSDAHLYDCGQIFIWTSGQANTSQIGELRVVGTVILSNPSLETSTSVPPQFQVSWFQSTAAQTFTTTVATTSLNGTVTANGLSINNTTGSMVPPVGNYIVDFTCSCADSAAEAYTVIMDFKKAGTSVYQVAANIPEFKSGVSLGAAEQCSLSGSVFVTASGGDTFTQVITMTGAAGVLTGGTSVRWTAV